MQRLGSIRGEIALDAVNRCIVLFERQAPVCEAVLSVDFLKWQHLRGLGQALGQMEAVDDAVPGLQAEVTKCDLQK